MRFFELGDGFVNRKSVQALSIYVVVIFNYCLSGPLQDCGRLVVAYIYTCIGSTRIFICKESSSHGYDCLSLVYK